MVSNFLTDDLMFCMNLQPQGPFCEVVRQIYFPYPMVGLFDYPRHH